MAGISERDLFRGYGVSYAGEPEPAAQAAPPGRCGAWMPVVRDQCARLPGHRDRHRTRYALDNNRALQRSALRERVAS